MKPTPLSGEYVFDINYISCSSFCHSLNLINYGAKFNFNINQIVLSYNFYIRWVFFSVLGRELKFRSSTS